MVGASLFLLAASDARAKEILRVSGTGAGLGTMRRLGAAFQERNPGVRVEVLPSVGTSGAFKAVADGALDIGLGARPPLPAERALGLSVVPYARTPFVLAAGPRSGIGGLTEAEAVRIYSGEMERWPGGERVRLVLRPRGDADTLILRDISPAMAAAVDAAMARQGMLVAPTNQRCHEFLLRTPGAVGPSTLAQILTEQVALEPLPWNGVPPTLENLASGAYPLEKKLYLVVRASPRPPVRRFLAFLASPEARVLIEQTGNLAVPLPPSE